MVNTEIYWSGSCLLPNILFESSHLVEYRVDHVQHSIDNIWQAYKKQYPESYDGNLIFLNEFEYEEDLDGEKSFLIVDVDLIRYSTIIGLQKLALPIDGYGSLGTQVAVFDENKEYILVGKRKYNQDYAPGLLTLPGGILEISDIGQPATSLLRELYEEVGIYIKNPKLVAILAEHTHYSTIFLIEAIIDQPFSKEQIFQELENEFDLHELHWIKMTELQTFESNQLMEGLTYYKNML